MNKTIRTAVAAAIVALGIVAAPAAAFAEPASIDNGQSPRDVGAKIEDGSGTPGPSYSTPLPKPSRGDYATDNDYRRAVAGWEAMESARKANEKASRG